MNTVYLIRHGQTLANRQHLYCGSTDLPLCQEGIRELEALRYQVGNARFLTSGMRRTEETLTLLFGPVPFQREPDFREMDFGVFEMKGYEALRHNPDYLTWISGDNEEHPTPGGESGCQMTQRVLRAWQRLDLQQDTVILTHGGPIAAIMAHLFPGENRNRYQWQPRPGHGYAITGSTYRPIP